MTATLRKFQPSDLDSLVRHANNYNVAKFLTDKFPHPYHTQDGEGYLAMACGHPGIFAIDVQGQAVGSIGLFVQEDVHQKNAELGYWLAQPYWGQGIVPKAIGEIVDYGFAHFDIVRIFARPFSANLASQRVLAKAGFALEAQLRKAIYKNGEYMDELIYARRKNE